MDPVTGFVYAYVLLLPVLDAAGFYYTYRISRVTGAFRGWNLLLLFVVLFCVEGLGTFFGGAVTAIFYPAQLAAYVARTGATTVVEDNAFNLASALVLLVAMFEIHSVFTRVQRRPEHAVRATGF
jgi:hypothetical protein